jgi:hypothetical protein
MRGSKSYAQKNETFRFAHYTRAESALKILREKRFWMRKANCMTDFLEVEHGINCIVNTYNKTSSGARFTKTLNEIFEGINSRIEPLFNTWIPSLKRDTYIACFSVHKPEDDAFGRLSMWRAYTANAGVALILRFSPSTTLADVLKVYTSPVAYLTDQEVPAKFDEITDNILQHRSFIEAQGSATIERWVFNMLRFAAVSIKHPSFREEAEWRLLYSPSLDKSQYLKKSGEAINGVPQPVFSIPLSGVPELDFASMLDRIIVGPTQYPLAVMEAFNGALEEFGLQDAAQKIFYSNIPLRT